MSEEFIPHPPTEQEIALYRNLFPNVPVHVQDYTHPPPDHQPPPQQGAPVQDDSKALVLVPTTSPSTPVDLAAPYPYPLPVSCIDQFGRHVVYSRGETTDDERTDTDDDVLPSPPPPPPPQQSLEQQLALAMNEIHYWSKVVNRGIQGEPERPDWLPKDWEMKCVTRTNGSSAGNKDKYYIEPGVKRRQFRSKREVLEFIETGKRRKYKRKAKSTAMPSNVNRPFEGTSSSSCLEASTSRQNEETPNLDSDTVPEKQNEESIPPPPNVDSDHQNPLKRPRGSPS